MAKFGQKQGYEKKLVGIVNVITGESTAKFTLTEEGKQFKNGTNVLKVKFDDLPKRPRLQPNDKSGRTQLRIRMNSEGTEVEALTPVVGVYDLELTDLGPRPEKDADPMPKEKVWNEGTAKENRYLEFFAVYQIESGNFKGVSLPAYNLHYKFEEDSSNPGFAAFTFSLSNKQATRGRQLADWGDLHGVWSVVGEDVEGEPIVWDDDTILPELLERALEQPKVRGVIKNGYITEILPRDEEPEFLDEPESLDDEIDIDDPVELEKIVGTPEKDDDVDVTDVKVKSKAPKPNGKVKPAPKRVARKSSDEDDEL